MGSTLTVDNIVGATTAANVKLPAGSVLQTVSTSWNTQTAITAQSYTAITGASLAITPKFSTSKILVMVNLSTKLNDSNSTYANGAFQILRGSTNVSGSVPTDGTGAFEVGSFAGGVSAIEFNHRYTNNVIDSPSTTSATTYSVKGKVYGSAGGIVTVNASGAGGSGTSSLILMEISV
tara:strand:- start:903 stop:1436 length:534 start_codon:yes stop_codon:yes gene_type:complete